MITFPARSLATDITRHRRCTTNTHFWRAKTCRQSPKRNPFQKTHLDGASGPSPPQGEKRPEGRMRGLRVPPRTDPTPTIIHPCHWGALKRRDTPNTDGVSNLEYGVPAVFLCGVIPRATRQRLSRTGRPCPHVSHKVRSLSPPFQRRGRHWQGSIAIFRHYHQQSFPPTWRFLRATPS